jgi:hypothetical protein
MLKTMFEPPASDAVKENFILMQLMKLCRVADIARVRRHIDLEIRIDEWILTRLHTFDDRRQKCFGQSQPDFTLPVARAAIETHRRARSPPASPRSPAGR